MKRYLVFAGRVYYPVGGGKDLYFATNDLEEAKRKCDEYKNEDPDMVDYNWAHVFDNEILEEIYNV